MARRLFFVPSVHRGKAELHGEDAKHLTRVLRVEPGQLYHVSDNQQLYLAEVETAHKGLVSFVVKEELDFERPPVAITLYASLIKFDHWEWMLEKVTELNVSRIVPVRAERTDKGLDQAAVKRSERWKKIILEAGQQSRRVVLPELTDIIPFEEAVQSTADVKLFCDEEGGIHPRELIGRKVESAAILIGPEGGWTEKERVMASEWKPISLGKNVLRAETAAMAALTTIFNIT